ncbi:MAG: GGDEF domain-containing protein [bacterium]|nr:GGDEF domain-containing protein [bacterium]
MSEDRNAEHHGASLHVRGVDVLDGPDTAPGMAGVLGALRRWWKSQTAARIEDEVTDTSGGHSISRFVIPVVAPILVLPAILLIREPNNHLAAVTLATGIVALVYSFVGNALERSSVNPFWIAVANAAVYSSIISLLLITFSTFDHPREHLHWVIFLVYSIMIAASGMSDDPRQPVMAGAFAIGGYALVVIALRASVAAGTSPMAMRLEPEFEWVANSAKIVLLFGTTIVATASARRGRELRRCSLRDGLTGLLNRHALDQCLEHLERTADQNSQSLTVAMIDIDHFKRLNDEHGHATGDDVLRIVSAWLQRNFRATDLVARYGGEEFVVAFPGAADECIQDRLETLRAGLATNAFRSRVANVELDVTVSIGVARLPHDEGSVQDVLALADSRLYQAKRAGRNRIVSS